MRLEDFRSARLACILTNAFRNTEKQPEPFELEDFFLIEPEQIPNRKQDPEDMLVMVQALNAFYGGTVIIDDAGRN